MDYGTIQLTSITEHNDYFTKNPEISLFMRNLPKRIGNYDKKTLKITATGNIGFGNKISFNIPPDAHVINNVKIMIDLPELRSVKGSGKGIKWIRNLGHHIFKNIQIRFGKQIIDGHTGYWLDIWNKLTLNKNKEALYNNLIGNTSDLNEFAETISAKRIYIPLQFFFNRDKQSSLPLIAMYKTKVLLEIEFKTFNELYILDSGSTLVNSPKLSYVMTNLDYIHLDETQQKILIEPYINNVGKRCERVLEYIIETSQIHEIETTLQNIKIDLPFKFPIKTLYWVIQPKNNIIKNELSNYTDALGFEGNSLLDEVEIRENNVVRIKDFAEYFNLIQPYDYHTGEPSTGIYMYSYCEEPENVEPTGMINMSALKSFEMIMKFTSNVPKIIRIFGFGYNVLRICKGRAGLMYLV